MDEKRKNKNKEKSKNEPIEITISTYTYKFLKQYCPHSMTTSLIRSEHKPRSKNINVVFEANKIDCLLQVIGDANLVVNVNAKIEKDLRKIIAKIE